MCGAVRTVTIDKGSLAAMGSEKRWIQRGETTLREEQKAFIGRYSRLLISRRLFKQEFLLIGTRLISPKWALARR